VTAGILASILLALTVSVGGAGDPRQASSAGSHGHRTGRPHRTAGPLALADGGIGAPGRPHAAPGNPLPPAASGRPLPPAAPRLPDGAPAAGTGDVLARIPKFPPALPAEKITLPQGPHAAWLSRIPTSQKVAFLTIDDGWTKQPEAIRLVEAAHVPVTLFLTMNAIRGDPAYFKRLQAAGAVIEAHTITHAELIGKSHDFQRQEICGSADQLGAIYGRRPVLFRPPFGDKDATTLAVARECGMKAAFFWKETVDKGVVRFQEGHTVQAGDIILMHFRPAFVDDFLAALEAIHNAGLTPALLEDYIA
jgi:peptidoglycan/xylan/chitin deacetylase (PgdA/CDA1 family)